MHSTQNVNGWWKNHYSFAIDLKSIQVNEMKKEYSDFFLSFYPRFFIWLKIHGKKGKGRNEKEKELDTCRCPGVNIYPRKIARYMLYINRLLQFDMCMLGKTYSLNILFWEQRFLWKNVLLIKLYSDNIQIQVFWYKYLIAKRHYLLEPLSWVKFYCFSKCF